MEIFIPNGNEEKQALEKTTHLAIAAHHDDIEIMAYDGILKCFNNAENWFTGVVVTNGSGSPRSGVYSNCSDAEMMKIRKQEQKNAAQIGKYSAQVFFDLKSSEVVENKDNQVVEMTKQLIKSSKPKIVYTHNLADKHTTHIAVAIRTIQALRELEPQYLPERVYGCEVWRGLDWLDDNDKIKLDVKGNAELESEILKVFDSQIAGGKRYDLATIGRRLANATFSESGAVDQTTSMIYAMDLTPLIDDKNLRIEEFIENHINKFKNQILEKIKI